MTIIKIISVILIWTFIDQIGTITNYTIEKMSSLLKQ